MPKALPHEVVDGQLCGSYRVVDIHVKDFESIRIDRVLARVKLPEAGPFLR
jgi:hypothetical protein